MTGMSPEMYVQWGVKSVDPVGIKMIARLYTQLPYKLSVFLVYIIS